MPKHVTSLWGPNSVSLGSSNTALKDETLQQPQVVGNTILNLSSPKFEPQFFHSSDERVSTRPTGLYLLSQKAEISDTKLLRYSLLNLFHYIT